VNSFDEHTAVNNNFFFGEGALGRKEGRTKRY